MKKLILDIDALAVESFATVAEAAGSRGTVLARGVTIADTVRHTEDDVYTCAPGVGPTVDTCVYPCVPPEEETTTCAEY